MARLFCFRPCFVWYVFSSFIDAVPFLMLVADARTPYSSALFGAFLFVGGNCLMFFSCERLIRWGDRRNWARFLLSPLVFHKWILFRRPVRHLLPITVLFFDLMPTYSTHTKASNCNCLHDYHYWWCVVGLGLVLAIPTGTRRKIHL